MRSMLRIVMLMGVLCLPGPLWAQVATPKAPEADEVKINQANVPTAADVLAKFTPGVEELQIRGLNPQQADAAFLSSTNNPLVDIGNGLKPGQKVDIRTTDGQRFRVQNEDGQLRFRVRDVNLGTTDPQALAAAFPAGSRVEIRGVNAAGQRVRFEMRNGVVKKNEVEADHSGKGRTGTSSDINNEHAKDRGKDLDHSIRGRDRAEIERMKREDRPEKMERMERMERPEKMEKIERMERIEIEGRH